ncbi:MAG TPA: efflux RND transporter periplasmic adaptor subunit, partial [Burkholderiaceae bacterium]|nr:efflux RND transporter periplasmic adaptor subunit [Burkholderiaceae bacterium]
PRLPGAVPRVVKLPGRLQPLRVAEVRARVPGIVQQRLFREGSQVDAGQPLFEIDPAPLQAALRSAQASLAKARAALEHARQRERRFEPLVRQRAISQQEFDDIRAERLRHEAEVAAAAAAVETAQLNLGYAQVTAPIGGRTGRALVTEGALVGQGEPTLLTTIRQIDPMLVDITQSAADVLRLQRAIAAGELEQLAPGEIEVLLVMPDGAEYPHPGRLLFKELSVDPATGSVAMRAEVPNPDGLLLPGMHVRARLAQAIDARAITVPQQAVLRTATGSLVMLVDDDERVVAQPVVADVAWGDQWVVSDGLAEGDRVIVEGLQRATPGARVTAVPWRPAEYAGGAVGRDRAGAPAAAGGANLAAGQPPSVR